MNVSTDYLRDLLLIKLGESRCYQEPEVALLTQSFRERYEERMREAPNPVETLAAWRARQARPLNPEALARDFGAVNIEPPYYRWDRHTGWISNDSQGEPEVEEEGEPDYISSQTYRTFTWQRFAPLIPFPNDTEDSDND